MSAVHWLVLWRVAHFLLSQQNRNWCTSDPSGRIVGQLMDLTELANSPYILLNINTQKTTGHLDSIYFALTSPKHNYLAYLN